MVETGPRWAYAQVANITTNGRLVLTYMTPDVDTVISKLGIFTGATAAAGATLARLGLYTVDGSGNVTLVARTSDVHSTLAIAGTTEYQVALDSTGGYVSSYTMLSGTRYALAWLTVGNTTNPTIYGPSNGVPAALLASSPRMCSRYDAQTDLPASVTIGNLVNHNTMYYMTGVI